MTSETLLFWDCTTCPSGDVEFIRKLEDEMKFSFRRIIVCSPDPSNLSSACAELPYAYDVVFRFGGHSLSESIIDVVRMATTVDKFSAVVISDNVEIWLTLFQRINPERLVIIGQANNSEAVEFAFLPQTVKTTLLSWPNLEPFGEFSEQEEAFIPSELSIHSEVSVESNTTEDNQLQDDDSEELFQSPSNVSASRTSRIKPLADDTPEQNYSSLLNTPTKRTTPIPSMPQRSDVLEVPKQFMALTEAIRSTEKAMVQIAQFEEAYRAVCEELGEEPLNTNTIISRASDAGLVIFDRTINYIRFRNRAMLTAEINYV